MRVKVDENLPIEVAELLRAAGHDAVTVYEQAMSGASDMSIADVCRREDRAVITMDTDFANIQSYPPEQHPGIVVL